MIFMCMYYCAVGAELWYGCRGWHQRQPLKADSQSWFPQSSFQDMSIVNKWRHATRKMLFGSVFCTPPVLSHRHNWFIAVMQSGSRYLAEPSVALLHVALPNTILSTQVAFRRLYPAQLGSDHLLHSLPAWNSSQLLMFQSRGQGLGVSSHFWDQRCLSARWPQILENRCRGTLESLMVDVEPRQHCNCYDRTSFVLHTNRPWLCKLLLWLKAMYQRYARHNQYRKYQWQWPEFIWKLGSLISMS